MSTGLYSRYSNATIIIKVDDAHNVLITQITEKHAI
jgi:hypothetical protein